MVLVSILGLLVRSFLDHIMGSFLGSLFGINYMVILGLFMSLFR